MHTNNNHFAYKVTMNTYPKLMYIISEYVSDFLDLVKKDNLNGVITGYNTYI